MDDPYSWHAAALAGQHPAIHEDEVHVGWFCRRMEYRGRLFPARIFWQPQLDDAGETISDDVLRCEVAGVRCDPYEAWIWLAKLPISKDEYEMLMAELFMEPVYRGPTRPISRWLEERTI